jgi:hypothetical protein
MNNEHVWRATQAQHGEKVELMKETRDWSSIDWVIKK